MKFLHPLTLAIAVLVGSSFVPADALAQRAGRESRSHGQEEPTVDFPNATRAEPKVESSSRLARQMKALQDAYDAEGKQAEAIEVAETIIANDKATAYDKAVAMLMAGSAARETDDFARAADYISRAIASDALPNNNHFSAMLMLGDIYYNNEEYDKAAEILTRMVGETSSTDPQAYLLLGASYYNSDKYQEAIAPLKKAVELATDGHNGQAMQMLMAAYAETGNEADAVAMAESMQAANPEDKQALLNLVTLYTNADLQDKAVALLDQARSKGMITTADDYKRLYALYFNLSREGDAAVVIQEGLDKNVLTADGETYMNLAQAHYFSDNIPAAIAAAQKGAPLAANGQLSLFLAQVLNQEDRYPESIAAAREAVAKGVAKPGEAWMVIASSEFYSDNIPGAKAAYQEAAKDPSTRSQAQTELAKLNR